MGVTILLSRVTFAVATTNHRTVSLSAKHAVTVSDAYMKHHHWWWQANHSNLIFNHWNDLLKWNDPPLVGHQLYTAAIPCLLLLFLIVTDDGEVRKRSGMCMYFKNLRVSRWIDNKHCSANIHAYVTTIILLCRFFILEYMSALACIAIRLHD